MYSIDIQATPTTVFSYLTSFTKLQMWTELVEMEPSDSSSLGPGDIVRVFIEFEDVRVPFQAEILENVLNERIVFETIPLMPFADGWLKAGPSYRPEEKASFVSRTEHVLEPIGEGSTRLHSTTTYTYRRWMDRLRDKLTQKKLTQKQASDLNRLKQTIEKQTQENHFIAQ